MKSNRQVGSIKYRLFSKTCVLAFMLSLCTMVRGAIWTVTSTADIIAAGTLRFAVINSAPNDTINFDSALAGQTITLLNLGELQITKNLVISGPGPTNLTIVNNNGRVFHVMGAVVNATVSGLKLTGRLKGINGNAGTLGNVNGVDGQSVTGGCIQNDAPCILTVSNCFFTECEAIGGAGGNGYTNVLYGFISRGGDGGSACGGAIFNNGGDLFLYHSTFAKNLAAGGKGGNGYFRGTGGEGGTAQGGAVCHGYGNQDLVMVNCTFHANSASAGSGGNAGNAWVNQIGPANGGTGGRGGNAQGGAVHIESGCPLPDCTGVVHCTLNQNEILPGPGRPGGNGINGGFPGAHGINGSAEGGGLSHKGLNPGEVPINNTIIARNFATFTFTVGNIEYRGPDVFGTVASFHSNFIGVKDAHSSGWVPVLDFLGSTLLPLDPLLGPLQNNGGETLTLAPLSCSPVIDKGSLGGFNRDQVLQTRPVGITASPYLADGSDIGAFELQIFPTNAPSLSITQSVNQVTVLWRLAFNCFVLQENSDLLATNWVNSTNAVTIVGNQCQVIVSPPTGNRFYRLFHP